MEFDMQKIQEAMHLDSLDREIINAYWLSPKAGNAAVARQLGVSEATVRRRLRALVDSDVLQFQVVLGPSVTAGYVEFQMAVTARGDKVENIAETIASLSRARYVAVLGGGQFDILVAASVPTMADWFEFRATIASIDGVLTTETFPVARVLKRATKELTPDDITGGRSEPNGGGDDPIDDAPLGAEL